MRCSAVSRPTSFRKTKNILKLVVLVRSSKYIRSYSTSAASLKQTGDDQVGKQERRHMSDHILIWKKKNLRPRTLYDVNPRDLKLAVRKMCRELGISPALPDRYDLYKACVQERENEIDKRFWMLEA